MRSLGVFLAMVLLATACSNEASEEIRLVSRVPHDASALRCDDGVSWTFGNDLERPTIVSEMFRILEFEGTHCEADLADVTLRNLNGLTAVASGFGPISSRTLQFADTDTPCTDPGGDEAFASGIVRASEPSVITLTFDDGAVAALTPELGTFVMSTCYAETGQWAGSAGSLAGRSGTYRWIEGPLQIELVLTDSKP